MIQQNMQQRKRAAVRAQVQHVFSYSLLQMCNLALSAFYLNPLCQNNRALRPVVVYRYSPTRNKNSLIRDSLSCLFASFYFARFVSVVLHCAGQALQPLAFFNWYLFLLVITFQKDSSTTMINLSLNIIVQFFKMHKIAGNLI